MGKEAPTFGKQAQHLSHPHPGGGGGARGIHPPANHQNQHAPLKVASVLEGLACAPKSSQLCFVCGIFHMLYVLRGDFKCSHMALAWSEMCMPHFHTTFMLSCRREQNGCRAKWEQKCNTQVLLGLKGSLPTMDPPMWVPI